MPNFRTSAGIDLHAETFDGGTDTVLLVMGLGAQMLLWPDEFCAGLADRGYRVVRYDNRDVGLSSRMDHLPTPSVARLVLGWAGSSPPPAPYSLADLADDAVGLLDAMDIERAHVVGASMGGMIAQLLAIEHPERVASLTSIMSTPWAPLGGIPAPRALKSMVARPQPTRESTVAHMVRTYQAIGSPILPPDPDHLKEIAERCFERGVVGRGFFRQLSAVLDAPDRRAGLATLELPVLVMHGGHDPLVRVRGGRETARAVPGAEWLLFEPMGHDLPRPLWPAMHDALERTIARAL